MEIVQLKECQIGTVIEFSNQYIGKNYYSEHELKEFINPASFILTTGDQVLGVRLTQLPEKWFEDKKHKLHSGDWKVSQKQIAYFQSQFLAPSVRGQGWGRKLSLKAIEVLKSLGVKAIVTHSWVESPYNSSFKSLVKLGFVELREIPHFWADVDYLCSGCQKKPCLCTAKEMILYL